MLNTCTVLHFEIFNTCTVLQEEMFITCTVLQVELEDEDGRNQEKDAVSQGRN